MKVPLPEPATQVACGDNHTVVLLQSGQIFTFGKHQEGQLGRQKQEEDDESWHMVPRSVSGFGDHRKAMWIGARGNQTFIAVDESLVSENSIGSCKVFGNSQMIGTFVFNWNEYRELGMRMGIFTIVYEWEWK